MYEIQRRKGRLLTASSLALAVILTTGASSAWAQGNNTIPDGGTVSGGDASTPITIVGATGTTADVNLGGATTTSVLGANGSVDTIEVSGANTLTIAGTGGNLVENTDTKSAINLAIGLGTTVEVTGKGGTVGDVTGKGAGSSTFNVIGKAGDNTVVTGKTLSGVTFTFDPATVNFDDIKDSAGTVKNQTTLNVTNDITNTTGSALLITADDNSVINVGGNVVDTNLTADNSSTITVGENVENKALATKLELNADNGSTITVKGDLVDTSGAGFTSVVQNGGQVTIEGKIANLTSQVGTSGIIDLGPRTSAVTAGMKTLGILGSDGKVVAGWGTANKVLLNNGTVNTAVSNQPISSLMTINKATAITDNSSFIVGKTTPATATAEFAAGSLLMVDAANGGSLDVSASTGTKDAIIDDDASLYIVNARVADTTILSGFTGGITATTNAQDEFTEGWGKNLRFDSRLFNGGTVTENAAGDSVSVKGNYIGANNAYGRISNGTANMIDGLYMGNANAVDSSNAGIKFVSRAVNENYLDHSQNNGKQVVTTLEGAAAMAATAGVQTSTYSISNTLAENYNARLSYLRDTAPAAGSGEAGTIGVWINPFYNSTDVDGVRIGRYNGEYEFNYGGGTIGIDSNISDNFRLGLAFSAGGGDTESKGSNFNKTESDFDFWGLGVYGSYTNGMFGLTGDISYSSTSYDIDQRLPGALGMNKLTADVDTDAFTVGLTGEYRFLTSNNLNIIPHLGLRYTNLKTDSYRVKEKGVGNVFKISSETQNIWTIPLGVTFTGEVATSSDWVIQPKADLGVIFAAGDLDADSKFRINGTNYGGRLTADDVVDAVTFNGLVGLKAENCDGFSVGLDYNFKASDNLTSHGVTGTIRYDF